MNKNGINVLSLFDGISGGRIALERAGIKVNGYHASEIDESAIKICQSHWKDVTEIGDVKNIDGTKYEGFLDLLCGGSPCQNFSFCGTQKGMVTKENIEVTSLEQYLELKENGFEFQGYSYLFWEYVRILKESKPKYFLLENVVMAKKWQDIITKTLGVEPIMIDSKLVSAQGRRRLYWTNIPNITQPQDKHIGIEDILVDNLDYKPTTILDYSNYDKSKVDFSKYNILPITTGASRVRGCRVRNSNKAFTLTTAYNGSGILTKDGNIRNFSILERERLQTLPDNYTNVEGITQQAKMRCIGNGWTIDVIAHIFKNIPQ